MFEEKLTTMITTKKTNLCHDGSILRLHLSKLGCVGKCTNKKSAIGGPIGPIHRSHIQRLGAQSAPLRVHEP
jgi:hypothetical protein